MQQREKKQRPADTGRHRSETKPRSRHRDTRPMARRRRDDQSTTTAIVALTDQLYQRQVTRDGRQ